MSIGFGRESDPGPLTMPEIHIPVIGEGEEPCAVCSRVGSRKQMHRVGSDEDGSALYICHRSHGKRKP